MWRFWFGQALVLLMVFSAFAKVQEIQSDSDFKKILQSHRYVLVDFYSTSCGPCKEIAPKFQLLSQGHAHVHFLKVDANEFSSISQEYNINSVPTFILFINGKENQRGAGMDGFLAIAKSLEKYRPNKMTRAKKQTPVKKQLNPKKVHPVIIIGSGPAAYTAAIYTARAGLNPMLYEGKTTNDFMPGGQLKTTLMVENYPGFPNDIDGSMLVDRMRLQGKRFGTTIVPKMIIDADFTKKPFQLYTDKKDTPIYAHSVIIATGARPKRLGIPGEGTFWQKGISTCAVCDGPFYKNKIVAVVGGGDSAAEEALHLAKLSSKVYLIVRKDSLKASNIMANRVKNHSKIKILWKTVVKDAKGKKQLESVTILSNGRLENLSVDGLFYAIGHVPNSDFLKHSGVSLDKDGFVKTQRGSPKTNIPGIFAAGDIHDRIYRQAITAAGFGAMAASECEKYLVF